MPDSTRQPGDPYCSNCGYDLIGAIDSARCPECGRPLVEVLVRDALQPSAQGKRYRSPVRLMGLPLIDLAIGPGPDGPRGKARGFVAIGDQATGILALGGQARGVVAFGGLAIGGFTAGGCSIGLCSAVGGCAIGGFAMGGGAIGAFARGGGAAGFMADGGGAIGYYARGGGAFGRHVISPIASDPTAVTMFSKFSWYFGTAWPPNAISFLTTLLGLFMFTLTLGAVVGAVAWIKHGRSMPTLPG